MSICYKPDVYSNNTTITTPFPFLNKYFLRLEVCSGEQSARVILFEAAKYLLGRSMQDYIESTSVCFEIKCAHHVVEKTGPLKRFMQWYMVDL
ncbi:hypothetical protein H5410_021606 [Solanum commersonii]|uniref:Uncharacterized protein n=1 Tax=Solanum commersonii TaxID=4109 RepID=A0A9J5ZD18_SOLCO|nr:hypothetical protein H5410_021606 [Solanum commersonii]